MIKADYQFVADLQPFEILLVTRLDCFVVGPGFHCDGAIRLINRINGDGSLIRYPREPPGTPPGPEAARWKPTSHGRQGRNQAGKHERDEVA
jgi:hypothetical protein